MASVESPQSSDSIGRILETIAREKGIDVASLPPLYEVIDPDALESLLYSAKENLVTVEFSYASCDISVDNTGDVAVLARGP